MEKELLTKKISLLAALFFYFIKLCNQSIISLITSTEAQVFMGVSSREWLAPSTTSIGILFFNVSNWRASICFMVTEAKICP
ncbi:hypothetical protein [Mangrovibacillus cuniculi]|uniref:Uncharacterized protein n=1 Tax=Mangrovibacillus cuniculi TaxID=2593652 RepID=A0A7S8HEJ1_9BACI|nr:hypothetical protein [Mangrovibacillus cuniculi]QPC45889.1 hypothetical protein G8O30_02405 [Mangrovibacillus cuniculi]